MITTEIQTGDDVLFLDRKRFNGKLTEVALIGKWDGEKVCFDDQEKTTVRNKQYLYKIIETNKKKKITIEYIVEKVSNYFYIPVETIKSKSRKTEVVNARQLCHYFARELFPKKPFREIGLEIGEKNHATCLNSLKVVSNLYETDKKYRKDVDKLSEMLKSVKF